VDRGIDSPYTLYNGQVTREWSRERSISRRRVWVLGGIGVFLAAALLAGFGTGYAYERLRPTPLRVTDDVPAEGPTLAKAAKDSENKRKGLAAKLTKTAPRGAYIVIDQTQNRVYVRKGDEVLRTCVASTGSGFVLRDASRDNGRTWTFDTPRGQYRVISKRENPVWKKPDWAFIEEGRPVPRRDSDRFEDGVLGKYALYFGNGFMIHGTLYERLLGRSVSHGCIRLGREDLKALWDLAPIGTPIYIY